MSKVSLLSIFAILFSANIAVADLGFDRLIVNSSGRCWRIINRDFNDRSKAESAVVFSVTNVTGTGQTDDVVTFDLMFKEDFDETTGWDETKTRQYSGSGVVTTVGGGKVKFELLVDLGNGDPPVAVNGYYHPGAGTSDSDDRIVLNMPSVLTGDTEDPCAPTQVEEGGTL